MQPESLLYGVLCPEHGFVQLWAPWSEHALASRGWLAFCPRDAEAAKLS